MPEAQTTLPQVGEKWTERGPWIEVEVIGIGRIDPSGTEIIVYKDNTYGIRACDIPTWEERFFFGRILDFRTFGSGA